MNRSLIAYKIPGYETYPAIIPAPADRAWIDQGTKGWANRCLPLRIANQAGWMVLNSADVECVWNGGTSLNSLRVESPVAHVASSMFGYGIVTFIIPYVFRTPEGFNMMARGPANLPKSGASPLEGITETDWLPYSFTMNWQITQKFKIVKFARGEPICMLTPIRRGDVESFEPEVCEMDAELLERYRSWHESREENVAKYRGATIENARIQGHYIRGEDHSGDRAHGHQTKLPVKPFPGMTGTAVDSSAGVPGEKNFWRRLFGR